MEIKGWGKKKKVEIFTKGRKKKRFENPEVNLFGRPETLVPGGAGLPRGIDWRLESRVPREFERSFRGFRMGI